MRTAEQTTTQDKDQGQDEFDKNPSLPPVNRAAEKTRAERDAPWPANPKEEALDTVKRSLSELNDALSQGKSETIENYLSFLAKFHNYSVNNSMLIAAQCPSATQVASYDKWQQLGRQVRKGEKGIGIFAPIIARHKVDIENDDGATEQREMRRLNGFRIAKVFDVSQTDGDKLPEPPKMTGDPGEDLERLETVIAENNIELLYDYPARGALGTSSGGRITVRPDLEPPQKFAVLAHELAHELLHKGQRRHETTLQVRETEAEAVAFVVSKAIGLDCGSASSDYIALYRGDSDVLKESLHFIQKTASRIIWGLTKDRSETPF